MAGRLENYKEDTVILREGELNKRLYVVNEGAVVLYMNYGLKDEYVVGVCGKNKIFGEEGMLIGEPNRYTVVAFENCKVTWMDENMLINFFKDCPEFAYNLLKKFASANKMYSDSLKRLVLETVNEKKGNGNCTVKRGNKAADLFEQSSEISGSDKIRKIESHILQMSDKALLQERAENVSIKFLEESNRRY